MTPSVQKDHDFSVLQKLKETGIPMELRVFDAPMEKRRLMGYEIDNSILITKNPLEVLPLLEKVKIIELRFYLYDRISWYYDFVFLTRHNMVEKIMQYLEKFQERHILYLAREIVNYKRMKETRIIKILRNHSQLLNINFNRIDSND